MLFRQVLDLLLVRFLLVGMLNTGFSFGVYSLFVWLGLPFALASLLSLLIGLCFSFKTQGALVFSNSSNGLFLRFVAGWGVVYVLNVSVIYGLIGLGIDEYIAGGLALAPTVLASYVLQRYVIFGRPQGQSLSESSRK